MELKDKKQMMADKMYCQYGEGKGASPKFKMRGETTGKDGGMGYKMNQGSDKGGGQKTKEAVDGSFKGKYDQGKKDSILRKMINGSVKSSQKGKKSLKSTGNNMGESMMLGKDGDNRA